MISMLLRYAVAPHPLGADFVMFTTYDLQDVGI